MIDILESRKILWNVYHSVHTTNIPPNLFSSGARQKIQSLHNTPNVAYRIHETCCTPQFHQFDEGRILWLSAHDEVRSVPIMVDLLSIISWRSELTWPTWVESQLRNLLISGWLGLNNIGRISWKISINSEVLGKSWWVLAMLYGFEVWPGWQQSINISNHLCSALWSNNLRSSLLPSANSCSQDRAISSFWYRSTQTLLQTVIKTYLARLQIA